MLSPLNELSDEMEGGIKVVSIERSLQTQEPPRQKKVILLKGQLASYN